jgi:hypothetical protein
MAYRYSQYTYAKLAYASILFLESPISLGYNLMDALRPKNIRNYEN